MKKCPMMMNGSRIKKPVNYGTPLGGRYGEYIETSENYDCIGSECSAYTERTERYSSQCGGAVIDKCHEWSCAALPREVWHDVQDGSK